MSSFFLKVAIALRKHGNLGVLGTETHEYHEHEVVLWKLSKGHTMVLVRDKAKKVHLEYKFYTQYYKVVRKWMLSDELYLLHKYRSNPHDPKANQDEFRTSKTQKAKKESRPSQPGTRLFKKRDQDNPNRDDR
ncbi:MULTISPECIES: hypothetical protein [Vibrio]|uniref:hypothetical protein n=1 Tax=Vibrio TaxID=662 RepID=UPI00078E0BA3|nr:MULTISPECIES: hypothetical protein [Vibrio]BAU70852.1 hypothetical protein [Vibrio sp. 04Ya108]BBM67579.1 hypothetical protein VA249_42250 [Vibrio alfacsensis]BCN27062.1 hypothetical protein VYA_42540 [Vibrio alfacsensis]